MIDPQAQAVFVLKLEDRGYVEAGRVQGSDSEALPARRDRLQSAELGSLEITAEQSFCAGS